VCLLVRLTVVDRNKAVVCFVLAVSAIIVLEKMKKRKMRSKKWHLKRNILLDAHLLNELLDAIVVSAGKLRKLLDSLSELGSSLCEVRLEYTVPCKVPTKCTLFH
jgi:hypothetical protein